METKILTAIKSSWAWVGIRPTKLYWINKFGNIILQDEGGCYWLLRPEELSCEIIAWKEEEMGKLWKDEDFILDWEMAALVEIAEKKLGKNDTDRCFYFITSPILGGSYHAENIQIVPLLELIAFSGDMAEQIKDLPEGSQIKLVITE
ncbi:MAG: T6SS immunity protein Tdi1 domain-containing protein [Hellea sp.]